MKGIMMPSLLLSYCESSQQHHFCVDVSIHRKTFYYSSLPLNRKACLMIITMDADNDAIRKRYDDLDLRKKLSMRKGMHFDKDLERQKGDFA